MIIALKNIKNTLWYKKSRYFCIKRNENRAYEYKKYLFRGKSIIFIKVAWFQISLREVNP
jgi:hypothetical protein